MENEKRLNKIRLKLGLKVYIDSDNTKYNPDHVQCVGRFERWSHSNSPKSTPRPNNKKDKSNKVIIQELSRDPHIKSQFTRNESKLLEKKKNFKLHKLTTVIPNNSSLKDIRLFQQNDLQQAKKANQNSRTIITDVTQNVQPSHLSFSQIEESRPNPCSLENILDIKKKKLISTNKSKSHLSIIATNMNSNDTQNLSIKLCSDKEASQLVKHDGVKKKQFVVHAVSPKTNVFHVVSPKTNLAPGKNFEEKQSFADYLSNPQKNIEIQIPHADSKASINISNVTPKNDSLNQTKKFFHFPKINNPYAKIPPPPMAPRHNIANQKKGLNYFKNIKAAKNKEDISFRNDHSSIVHKEINDTKGLVLKKNDIKKTLNFITIEKNSIVKRNLGFLDAPSYYPSPKNIFKNTKEGTGLYNAMINDYKSTEFVSP